LSQVSFNDGVPPISTASGSVAESKPCCWRRIILACVCSTKRGACVCALRTCASAACLLKHACMAPCFLCFPLLLLLLWCEQGPNHLRILAVLPSNVPNFEFFCFGSGNSMHFSCSFLVRLFASLLLRLVQNDVGDIAGKAVHVGKQRSSHISSHSGNVNEVPTCECCCEPQGDAIC